MRAPTKAARGLFDATRLSRSAMSEMSDPRRSPKSCIFRRRVEEFGALPACRTETPRLDSETMSLSFTDGAARGVSRDPLRVQRVTDTSNQESHGARSR